jgi:hypothetical protein
MIKRFLLSRSFLLIPALFGCAHAASGTYPVTASASSKVAASDSVLAHETFTIQSAALGELRKINVYTPPQYYGNRREFPVLFMPDGGIDEDFPHVIRTVDSLIALRAIRPIIVVGVPNTQRRRDLTGPTRIKSDSAIAPRVGGSAEFRLAKFSAKPRSLYIATSLEPSTSVGSLRIIEAVKASPPSGIRWKYEPRPDLTHATIFRGTKPTALLDAFH